MITHDIIKSLMPADRNSSLSDDDRAILVALDLVFEEQEGKTITKRKGATEALKDPKTLNPLLPEQAVRNYFQERGWIDGPARGAGGDFKTLTTFTEKWLSDNPGKHDICPEFQDALQKHYKAVPDFDFYS